MAQAVKVLPKGQITLPKNVRRKLNIAEGDMLTLEEKGGEIRIKKGKTIHEFAGTLPNLGMPAEEMIERSLDEAVKDKGK